MRRREFSGHSGISRAEFELHERHADGEPARLVAHAHEL
jgi:hypothetical protein